MAELVEGLRVRHWTGLIQSVGLHVELQHIVGLRNQSNHSLKSNLTKLPSAFGMVFCHYSSLRRDSSGRQHFSVLSLPNLVPCFTNTFLLFLSSRHGSAVHRLLFVHVEMEATTNPSAEGQFAVSCLQTDGPSIPSPYYDEEPCVNSK